MDRKAGLVHVTDYPEHIDRAAAYIESVERRLNRQVEIRARVIEVTLPDANAPAVDWTRAVLQARTATGKGETLDFDRFLAALARQGTVMVLTASDVRTLHNEQAVIRVGVERTAFEGFVLAVTPQIGADGTILMTVAPAVSRAVAEGHDGTSSAPVLGTSDLSTAVRVRDGETLVLPGLRRARSDIAVLLTTKVI
jgi:type II secretory pathway component GspD/PulD (secretin)